MGIPMYDYDRCLTSDQWSKLLKLALKKDNRKVAEYCPLTSGKYRWAMPSASQLYVLFDIAQISYVDFFRRINKEVIIPDSHKCVLEAINTLTDEQAEIITQKAYSLVPAWYMDETLRDCYNPVGRLTAYVNAKYDDNLLFMTLRTRSVPEEYGPMENLPDPTERLDSSLFWIIRHIDNSAKWPISQKALCEHLFLYASYLDVSARWLFGQNHKCNFYGLGYKKEHLYDIWTLMPSHGRVYIERLIQFLGKGC